jgi:hypothetical protein
VFLALLFVAAKESCPRRTTVRLWELFLRALIKTKTTGFKVSLKKKILKYLFLFKDHNDL